MKRRIICLFFSLILLLNACSPVFKNEKTTYFNYDIKPKEISKIAILPFENHTRQEGLSPAIREMVLAVVLSHKIFDVLDLSITDLIIYEEGLEKALKMDKGTIKRIGERLGVQALLLGSLNYAEEVREGSYSYPVVGISLRLIDVSTGEIIWQSTGIKNAYSLLARLFGVRSKSTLEICFELINDLFEDLRL